MSSVRKQHNNNRHTWNKTYAEITFRPNVLSLIYEGYGFKITIIIIKGYMRLKWNSENGHTSKTMISHRQVHNHFAATTGKRSVFLAKQKPAQLPTKIFLHRTALKKIKQTKRTQEPFDKEKKGQVALEIWSTLSCSVLLCLFCFIERTGGRIGRRASAIAPSSS